MQPIDRLESEKSSGRQCEAHRRDVSGVSQQQAAPLQTQGLPILMFDCMNGRNARSGSISALRRL
ncbi:MAG: hypothetical protein M3N97_04485 [Pseudomonadota bacterium]|nr:hypothetical protein [Pseudomonadota bacterium]